MRHYLLDPMEAELLACYRLLSDQAKAAVIFLIASQVDQGCHKLDRTVEMRIVEK
jgi:hypothetical protein